MQTRLQASFGNIDIYLFDQLLKGTYSDCQTVLDAGCGTGRNLIYFMQNNYQVYGIDSNPANIEQIISLSENLSPQHQANNFSVGLVEHLPYDQDFFDLVISSAVLHFAHDLAHFESMLFAMWKVIKPGGYLFARLASNIGIENLVKPLGAGKYLLPDGSKRFLVNQTMLLDYTERLKGNLHEPIKTTNVQNLRCMTTWCLKKM